MYFSMRVKILCHLWLYCFLLIFYLSLKSAFASNVQNDPLLLYSTKKDIRMVNTSRSKVKPKLLITNLTDGAALDFHYEHQKICWTDHGLDSVQCIGFNSTGVNDKVEVISTGVFSPDGLACDWFTNKLYWTDSARKKVEVASIPDQYRKVLFWTDMDQPRAIALDPMQGFMFWTDWGDVPKIEKAGMDGDPRTRSVIVSEDIFWPNGLTLDYENQIIYWIDGKLLFLKKMNYYGKVVSIIIKEGLEYPFALTQFMSKLFWTDWKKWSIYMYDKNSTKAKALKEPKEFLNSDEVPMDIHVWDPRRQPLKPHGCEKNNGGCSHLCLISPKLPFYACACPVGTKLLDNTTCAEGPQELLLFAKRSQIYIVYLDMPDFTHRILNLTNMKFSITVDYDPIEGFIYWTDSELRKLQRAKLDGSEQSVVLSFEVVSSDCIVIDWVARNIYWTDSELDRIEVANLNGKYRKVIISDGLLNPRAIAVAPNLGWLFWSDWHEKSPKIERSNLDGSERTILISDNLGWANGIALDIEAMKIYWCDAKNDIIEYSNMDGMERRVLLNDNIPHPFGFTLLGDYLYWTDWQRKTISRANKETGANREIIIEQVPNIMGLKAIKGKPLESQSHVNPCGLENGGCSQICLYLHNKTFTCVCQIGYELLKDGFTCVVPEAFILYSRRDSISRVSIENENNDIQLPIRGIKYASSIDYDINNMRIYWTDMKQHLVMRAYTNGSDPQKVVELGITSPEGLAVDWIALNIYWADSAEHKIEVARLDGSSRRVLLWGEANLEPHNIALDPYEGYMYWTEWAPSNSPNSLNSIKKAALNGSGAKKLIINMGYGTGLSLDYNKRRLYWSESSVPSILSSDLNGLNKIILVKEGIYKPVGLTLYKEFIYWLDETPDRKGEIFVANKYNGFNQTKLHTLAEAPTDLLIIPSTREEKTLNQCAVNNGDCSHLCLALPAQSPGDNTSYTCACPTHYVLKNNTCSPPKRFMIYSNRNLAVRLLPDTSECLSAVLPIQGLKSVKAIDFDPVLQFLYWIEGKSHSIKKAKAVGTHISVVVNGHQGINPVDIVVDALGRLLFWSCSEQDVINVTRVDNTSTIGVVVHEEGEKPRLLAIHPTKRLLVYTDVGVTPQIIRKKMDGTQKVVIAKANNVAAIAVDMENDMVVWAQGSSIYMSNIDGENHQHILNDSNSKITQLTVHSGWLYWFDRENLHRLELKTGSSRSVVKERDLEILDLISVMEPDKAHPCAQSETQSHILRCSHLCILNGSNPICGCPQGLALQEDKRTCATMPYCGIDFFTCSAHAPGNKDCIPNSWKCDGQVDCQDESDETGCPSCEPDQFRCQNGDCIDSNLVCDDIPQCRDKSDEAHCCKHPDEFTCPGTYVCIAKSYLCDGVDNCADGEDEKKSVCVQHNKYMSNGVFDLAAIVFWTFMSFLTVLLILVAFYYIRRNVYPPTVDEADQSVDPLNPVQNRNQIKTQKMRNKAIPDVVHMSMLNGSQVSYDRDHITGASSSNISSVACYPKETLNPPPSPATTAVSTRTSSPTARYRPYKHYRSINQPPPPTPCSTDICDESDYNYPTNSGRNRYDDRNRYDLGPFPPPPTPRSHCNSESCPPSPSSRSSTYFSPLPPPPSPVASPRRGYN